MVLTNWSKLSSVAADIVDILTLDFVIYFMKETSFMWLMIDLFCVYVVGLAVMLAI